MQTLIGETVVTADPTAPTLLISREFDASVQNVFRAHAEPDLMRRWSVPRQLTTEIRRWDCVTGGAYLLVIGDDPTKSESFGSFHEVAPAERIVQTSAVAGSLTSVSLVTTTFVDIGDERCRLETVSLYDSVATRDYVISSLMPRIPSTYRRLEKLISR